MSMGVDHDCFGAAVRLVQSMPKEGPFEASNELKLKLYALYKQVTEGRCSSTKPAFWDVVNRAKWNAWSELGGMSGQEAMALYVQTLRQVVETMPLDDVSEAFLKADGRNHLQNKSLTKDFETAIGYSTVYKNKFVSNGRVSVTTKVIEKDNGDFRDSPQHISDSPQPISNVPNGHGPVDDEGAVGRGSVGDHCSSSQYQMVLESPKDYYTYNVHDMDDEANSDVPEAFQTPPEDLEASTDSFIHCNGGVLKSANAILSSSNESSLSDFEVNRTVSADKSDVADFEKGCNDSGAVASNGIRSQVSPPPTCADEETSKISLSFVMTESSVDEEQGSPLHIKVVEHPTLNTTEVDDSVDSTKICRSKHGSGKSFRQNQNFSMLNGTSRAAYKSSLLCHGKSQLPNLLRPSLLFEGFSSSSNVPFEMNKDAHMTSKNGDLAETTAIYEIWMAKAWDELNRIRQRQICDSSEEASLIKTLKKDTLKLGGTGKYSRNKIAHVHAAGDGDAVDGAGEGGNAASSGRGRGDVGSGSSQGVGNPSGIGAFESQDAVNHPTTPKRNFSRRNSGNSSGDSSPSLEMLEFDPHISDVLIRMHRELRGISRQLELMESILFAQQHMLRNTMAAVMEKTSFRLFVFPQLPWRTILFILVWPFAANYLRRFLRYLILKRFLRKQL